MLALVLQLYPALIIDIEPDPTYWDQVTHLDIRIRHSPP